MTSTANPATNPAIKGLLPRRATAWHTHGFEMTDNDYNMVRALLGPGEKLKAGSYMLNSDPRKCHIIMGNPTLAGMHITTRLLTPNRF